MSDQEQLKNQATLAAMKEKYQLLMKKKMQEKEAASIKALESTRDSLQQKAVEKIIGVTTASLQESLTSMMKQSVKLVCDAVAQEVLPFENEDLEQLIAQKQSNLSELQELRKKCQQLSEDCQQKELRLQEADVSLKRQKQCITSLVERSNLLDESLQAAAEFLDKQQLQSKLSSLQKLSEVYNQRLAAINVNAPIKPVAQQQQQEEKAPSAKASQKGEQDNQSSYQEMIIDEQQLADALEEKGEEAKSEDSSDDDEDGSSSSSSSATVPKVGTKRTFQQSEDQVAQQSIPTAAQIIQVKLEEGATQELKKVGKPMKTNLGTSKDKSIHIDDSVSRGKFPIDCFYSLIRFDNGNEEIRKQQEELSVQFKSYYLLFPEFNTSEEFAKENAGKLPFKNLMVNHIDFAHNHIRYMEHVEFVIDSYTAGLLDYKYEFKEMENQRGAFGIQIIYAMKEGDSIPKEKIGDTVNGTAIQVGKLLCDSAMGVVQDNAVELKYLPIIPRPKEKRNYITNVFALYAFKKGYKNPELSKWILKSLPEERKEKELAELQWFDTMWPSCYDQSFALCSRLLNNYTLYLVQSQDKVNHQKFFYNSHFLHAGIQRYFYQCGFAFLPYSSFVKEIKMGFQTLILAAASKLHAADDTYGVPSFAISKKETDMINAAVKCQNPDSDIWIVSLFGMIVYSCPRTFAGNKVIYMSEQTPACFTYARKEKSKGEPHGSSGTRDYYRALFFKDEQALSSLQKQGAPYYYMLKGSAEKERYFCNSKRNIDLEYVSQVIYEGCICVYTIQWNKEKTHILVSVYMPPFTHRDHSLMIYDKVWEDINILFGKRYIASKGIKWDMEKQTFQQLQFRSLWPFLPVVKSNMISACVILAMIASLGTTKTAARSNKMGAGYGQDSFVQQLAAEWIQNICAGRYYSPLFLCELLGDSPSERYTNPTAVATLLNQGKLSHVAMNKKRQQKGQSSEATEEVSQEKGGVDFINHIFCLDEKEDEEMF